VWTTLLLLVEVVVAQKVVEVELVGSGQVRRFRLLAVSLTLLLLALVARVQLLILY
jgi:hypothetical protein